MMTIDLWSSSRSLSLWSDLITCSLAVLFNVYTSDGVHVSRESLENAIIASDGGIASSQIDECFALVSLYL